MPIELCELVCSYSTSKAIKVLRLITHSLYASLYAAIARARPLKSSNRDNGMLNGFSQNRTLLKDPYDEWSDCAMVSRLLKAAIPAAFPLVKSTSRFLIFDKC